MEKTMGYLEYDYDLDRFVFINEFDDGPIREMHCGDCFEVLRPEGWVPVQLTYDEHQERWYLPQMLDAKLEHLVVRM